jgi:hypothetical protein
MYAFQMIPQCSLWLCNIQVGHRASYIRKPDTDAGPQSYNIPLNFSQRMRPRDDDHIHRLISSHSMYGREFCRYSTNM